MLRCTKVTYHVVCSQYFTFFNIFNTYGYCEKLTNFVNVIFSKTDRLVPGQWT